MKIGRYICLGLSSVFLLFGSACQSPNQVKEKEVKEGKKVVYQVFTRLFGNTNKTNKPWGTIEENGVGKFSDFSEKALSEIKDLGVTHIWYTGVPHHDVITDYTKYGISLDDPDVVKGRAGSPYAVKDYYNVNPDLANNPENRLKEFESLIERTHALGMKVLIDIVPNHVARNYQSISKPEGVKDFGEEDDTNVAYARNNNFYYIPGKDFEVPNDDNFLTPLGGNSAPLLDGKFTESPAKWTGNGSRSAKPSSNDWYETVKVNYGVKEDGSYDFDRLPKGYDTKSYKEHFEFWKNKDVPSSWIKFRDIALFWTEKGVDGFRYDMAEMVPAEFWSYMNSAIKMINPDAFLMAEVYNPKEYRNYIRNGKMDYLYDKVELYDTLKHIMQGHGSTDNLPAIQNGLADIEHNMLHFLENHDEQRIASPDFAGDATKGKPAMVVSATISTSPTMIYFGQEVGEPAALNSGFGSATRTSIFDYCGVPNHQRWMNDGAFDGGQLSTEEKELRAFYKSLLNFTISSSALTGAYEEIHSYNQKQAVTGYDDKVFSFVRYSESQSVLVVSNFDAEHGKKFVLEIPSHLVKDLNLGTSELKDVLGNTKTSNLTVENGMAKVQIEMEALESFIFEL